MCFEDFSASLCPRLPPVPVFSETAASHSVSLCLVAHVMRVGSHLVLRRVSVHASKSWALAASDGFDSNREDANECFGGGKQTTLLYIVGMI